ncbi:hypothetical protein BT67DRAFT_382942 [Trichocladium antarcticum]|uniref:Cenp-O kinetochore centromere component n=1 Tax=Trichocladium antarcticum TaxID=1450529 RepID=A0AAN6UHW7_9PEZI|nr:hypothetical protein BT67DRAFT_382942 [Trichocladium antarcticum]
MASSLDDEIEDLQARVSSLKKQIRIQTSTLLTAPSTLQILSQQDKPPTPTPALGDTQPLETRLLAQSALQQAHNQQCLYRACATLTTFRATDPDPRAVDAGAILGLRIEVVSRARFLRPYYVLLNRPYASGGGDDGDDGSRRYLRVHRHTLPPCIPLAGLAGRYLPAPTAGSAGGEGREQDLGRFARALRMEVVRYHHRLGTVADLRKAAGLGGKKRGVGEDGGEEGGGAQQEEEPNRLVDISPADAEVKQLTIEWADGRTGRLVMGDDGEIVRLVAVGENGRDREAGRELLGGAARVDDVARRLAAMA